MRVPAPHEHCSKSQVMWWGHSNVGHHTRRVLCVLSLAERTARGWQASGRSAAGAQGSRAHQNRTTTTQKATACPHPSTNTTITHKREGFDQELNHGRCAVKPEAVPQHSHCGCNGRRNTSIGKHSTDNASTSCGVIWPVVLVFCRHVPKERPHARRCRRRLRKSIFIYCQRIRPATASYSALPSRQRSLG